MKPPCAVRLANVDPCGEVQPNAKAAASAMNAMIAATLMDANQDSNSPYERADMRLTPVITAMRPRPSCQAGNGIHACRMFAPAMASTGTTIIQKYQYSQPVMKPAQWPRP